MASRGACALVDASTQFCKQLIMSRIYIMTDMEGVSGICSEDQCTRGKPGYEQGRLWLTQDINAAIAGAREAGATEFVVNDGHGSRPHILLEQLESEGVTYEMPKSGAQYLPGLDATFAG